MQGLARFLRRRWRGYELAPGEAESGRVSVSSDVGGGLTLLANERLALTDRRLLLLRSKFNPLWILLALALTFLLHLHPFFFPLLTLGFFLLISMLRLKVAAAQQREDLMACEIEAKAHFLLKPKLQLRFRDGTRWRLYNPARGAGRLDAIVGMLHKGGIEAAAAGAPARSTRTG